MSELPLVGDEFAGYRLRSVLGRGGMGVVYRAENPRLGSVAALKALAAELATDDLFRAWFLEESRIAASLNHPHVIPIYDAGSSEGLLYIAMRYVVGTDLRQMIKKRGRIRPATALFLLGQAARALDAAHRQGLVHRDVKPGNLLIERGSDGADPGHGYLADFGVARHARSRSGRTSTGQFLGTIDYLAPEQIRGTSVVGLADQYSLGCVLYECLTGRVPFEKDLAAAVIWAHVEERPAMPTVLRPELPQEVDEVFARVLAKQPGDRYQSCREFIEAAGVALGVLATGPQTSSSPRGLAEPPETASPGSLGSGSRPDEPAGSRAFDWWTPGTPATSLANGSRVKEPAGSLAAGSQAGQAQQGNSLASPRREAGGAGPGGPDDHYPPAGRPGPRWARFLRPRWIAALAAVVLIAAGAATWAVVSSGSKSDAHGMGMSSMSAKPKPKPPTALMSALMLANQSGEAKGLLPSSSCKQQSATMITCDAPAPGITEVTFRTYPSLTSLYAAYVAKAESLNPGRFQANSRDCGINQTSGEVGWNHMFRHPKTYTVGQMSGGMVTDAQAAGRVFCLFSNAVQNFVWTQDDGHLLAWVTGPVHEDVWNWWVDMHHNIGFNGSPMKM